MQNHDSGSFCVFLRLRSSKTLKNIFVIFILPLLLSCKVYKQDIMFRLDERTPDLAAAVQSVEKNYVIQVDDILTIDIFTNDGERIIDPNFEFQMQGQIQNNGFFNYLVQQDGNVKVPIVGKVKLDSLTIDEAERELEKAFDEFYKGSFARVNYNNKRVVVLGANGGQIVPLANENMSLLEIVAISGGIDFGARAHNIRILRGDLLDPEVYVVNLNTVEGMTQSIIPIEPGDVIYIEPWRRTFFEGLRDITPVLSATTSLIAFVLLIDNLTENNN